MAVLRLEIDAASVLALFEGGTEYRDFRRRVEALAGWAWLIRHSAVQAERLRCAELAAADPDLVAAILRPTEGEHVRDLRSRPPASTGESPAGRPVLLAALSRGPA